MLAERITTSLIRHAEDPCKRALPDWLSPIRLPDRKNGAGRGADSGHHRRRCGVGRPEIPEPTYSTHIPAVILAVNNNPMRYTDRSGGVSRRRVIIHFPEQIAPEERDPQLRDKIARELAVIVRQLMQQFSDPMTARALLSRSRTPTRRSVLNAMLTRRLIFAAIWKLPETNGMFMGNANIIPRKPRKYLYHAYLAIWKPRIQERTQPDHVRAGGSSHAERVRPNYESAAKIRVCLDQSHAKRKADWLPKCDEPITEITYPTGIAGLFTLQLARVNSKVFTVSPSIHHANVMKINKKHSEQ